MKNLSLLIILCVGMASCAKTTKGKWMIYEEEVCLPFWADEDQHRKSKDNLEQFLKTEGIIPLKIRITGERLPECEACHCKTGLSYEVQVDESQSGHLLYYGFQSK